MTTLSQQPQLLFVDSGIQFIDYHLVIGSSLPDTHFIRESIEGPLCEVTADEKGHFPYYANDEAAVEWVRPEYRFSLAESLSVLQHHWLPIPYLSSERSTHPLRPMNWARAYLSPHPHLAKSWNITLAFDTAVSDDDNALQPSRFEVQQGQLFAFPCQPKVWQRFFQLPWVSGWIASIYPTDSHAPSFLWQAHYINLLKVLAHQVKPRPLLLREGTAQREPIAVDAIIDLGNSNSCGVLYEVASGEGYSLNNCSELQLRDLSCPTESRSTLFSSEINFAPEPFGHRGLSSASGRLDAFQWPSLVRIGPEAQRLNGQSHQDLQHQGITCPRRYIWDDHASSVTWFNATRNQQAEYSSIDHPLSLLINDQGTQLDELPSMARFPVFVPQFSRSTLFNFLIMELISQIAMQINSPQYRQRHHHSEVPRVIRRLTFTLPVNFTILERERFHLLAKRGIALMNALNPKFFPVSHHNIEVVFPWDEACCGQIFWLWQQLRQHSVPSLLQHYHRSPQTAHLRVALIDVGGGTTDLAITEYPSLTPDHACAPALSPQLLLRQGFTLAGDSLLEDVITHFLLPQLAEHLYQQGLTAVDSVLERLFSREKSYDGDNVWRQYIVRHLFLPIVDDILSRYRLQEPAYYCRVGQFIERDRVDFINASLTEKIVNLSANAFHVALELLTIQFVYSDFIAFLQSDRCRLSHLLTLISDTVTKEQCDVVLLSGQVMELPFFQQRFRQLPAHCCLLTELSTDAALPFCATGKLANGKHATSLGGLLYSLTTEKLAAESVILPGNISNVPVARWYGPLSQDALLQRVLLAPCCQGTQRTRLTLTHTTAIGYRCREEDTVIASPLFALIPNHKKYQQWALGVTVELEWQFDNQGELITLPRVINLYDSQQQPLDLQCVTLEMNTLSPRGDSREHYWRDDGRVMTALS